MYGFTSANPYTYEEQILDIKVAPKTIVNYRKAMRDNVVALAEFAKAENKNFEIIAHEGEELLHKSLWEYHLDGYNEARRKGINADDPVFLAHLKQTEPDLAYSASAENYGRHLSGIAVNNRFCGSRKLSPHIKEHGLKIISIDSCSSEAELDEAIMNSAGFGSLLYAFVKPETAFRKIKKQPIINENARNIYKVADAANISFFIDDSLYDDKERFLQDIRDSNYDIVVIEPFFRHQEPLSREDVDSLKFKKNRRQTADFCQNERQRSQPAADYYWRNGWQIDKTPWLARASFTDSDAVITEYWNENWKKVSGLYFKGIVRQQAMTAAFSDRPRKPVYFEKQTPLE